MAHTATLLTFLLISTITSVNISYAVEESVIHSRLVSHLKYSLPLEGCQVQTLSLTAVTGYRSHDVYNLSTTFMWDNGGANDLSYEVGLIKFHKIDPDGQEGVRDSYSTCIPNSCLSMVEANIPDCSFVEEWHNTSTAQITLEAPYSYEFILYIRPWNRAAGLFDNGMYMVVFPYQDCIERTNDAEFCRTQDIELASSVVNLTAEVINYSRLNSTVHVTWHEPIQFNKENACRFFIQFSVGSPPVNQYKSIGLHKNSSALYSWGSDLNPLRENEEYVTYKVMVRTLSCIRSLSTPGVAVYFNLTRDEVTSAPTRIDLTTDMDGHGGPADDDIFPNTTLMLVLIISIAVFSCVIFLIWFCTSHKESRFIRRNEEDHYPECHPVFAEKELYDPSKVKYDVTSPIGTGQYGNVYKGEMYCKESKDWVSAAIKVAKEHELGWKEDFLDEIKLILELGSHPNITKIVGCCTKSNPPLLVTEFMRYGDLLRFLHKCRMTESVEDDIIYSLKEADLLFVAHQVALGMKFISLSNFYHGDLAARNILVTEGLVAKISDFGLADNLYEKGYKRMAHGRKRPMRWVSLETLKSSYCSHQSDVWSFGVLLYEIFTLGATPYHDIPIHEISIFLEEGYRLPKPILCPQEIYNTMRLCWMENPADRPSFVELTEILDCIQQERETSGRSDDSFITNPDLRSVVFQPFFEEDEMSALPVSPTSLGDEGSSGIGSDLIEDSGSIGSTMVMDSLSDLVDAAIKPCHDDEGEMCFSHSTFSEESQSNI